MTQDDTPDIAVSFADVAAESADDSLTHQAEATDTLPDTLPDPASEQASGVESDNDTAPAQPTLSSMTGGGPVGDGDELAP